MQIVIASISNKIYKVQKIVQELNRLFAKVIN